MTAAGAFHCDPTSERWIPLEEHGSQTVIAAHPVRREEYRDYLRAVGLPISTALARVERLSAPVTDVAQVDAAAYCRWLGQREGREFCLPTIAELLELAREAEEEGISLEIWPHQQGNRPELRGGLKQMFLCEWTCEVEEMPASGGRPPRILGSVFYPPWLRHDSHTLNAQANLVATEGFSFVTFRVACPGAR